MAGAFGLVHGAGLSGHLTELLRSVVGTTCGPFVGFNSGIELGQIVVIAIPVIYAFWHVGKWEVIVSELSRIIAAVGVRFWLFQGSGRSRAGK